ncbi:MAG: 3-hydroxyacyl-CoA dehydrogenase [Desulfobacterales bacterium]|nr:3-hydroxyacyl-CoA dehydrogenase [Desulfobacterales bacterium]
MQIDDIKQVLIIGSGTMGQQIGFHCAAGGYDVIYYDISQELLDKAMKRAERLADRYVKSNRLSREEADAALARLHTSTDPQKAGQKADFVSESIPEDPELKGRVFAQFNEICPAHTIFTTNTSSLKPSTFAESTGRPDKFAAFHFHDLRVTPVVDIMPHPGTARETVALIEAFAKRNKLVPIMLKKENNGYVFNAMLMELFKSAQSLAARGVASVEDIDRAWMGVMYTPIGPFGLMDSIGLDTVWKITDYWANKLQDKQALANAEFMKQYVDEGRLGAKTGQGFYTYPDPAYAQPGFLEKKDESDYA